MTHGSVKYKPINGLRVETSPWWSVSAALSFSIDTFKKKKKKRQSWTLVRISSAFNLKGSELFNPTPAFLLRFVTLIFFYI